MRSIMADGAQCDLLYNVLTSTVDVERATQTREAWFGRNNPSAPTNVCNVYHIESITKWIGGVGYAPPQSYTNSLLCCIVFLSYVAFEATEQKIRTQPPQTVKGKTQTNVLN